MKKLLLILPLLVIFFASCEKDNIWKPDVENPGDGKETGKVTLSVKQEGAFTVVTKSEDAVAVADLRIRIWKGDVIVKEYAKYSQAPNVVELEPGDYTLEAGTTGDKEAAWSQPIYNGKKDFTIESGKVTSANVVCKLTNMKVTIKCTDNFINELNDDFVIVVSNGNQDGFLEYTKSIIEADKSGYFKVGSGKLTVHVKATRKLDGKEVNHYLELNSCNAQDHHVLTFDVQEVGEVDFGSVSIDVDYSVNNRDEEVVIPGEDETPVEDEDNNGSGEGGENPGENPGEGGENPGGNPGEGEGGGSQDTAIPEIVSVEGTYNYVFEGMEQCSSAQVNLIIRALNDKTIEHINVAIESAVISAQDLTDIGLGTNFSITDFGASQEEQERKQGLIDLGLIPDDTNGETPIKGKKEHTFAIGSFINMLYMISGGQVATSYFTVEVTDNAGAKNSVVVSIQTKP